MLVFYPLAFSPVCTDQLTVYQQALPTLEALGVDLYGVSVHSPFAQRAFRERLGVTFPLLADFDPKGALARSLGVYDQARGVSRRALVMIDVEGIVRWGHLAPSPLEIPDAGLILDAVAAA